MKFIRNVSLSKRLALGFGLLLTLLAIIVCVSVVRLNEQAAAMETVSGHAYPKVEAAQTMAYSVVDIARVTRNIILLSDKEAEAKHLAVYEQDRATIQKSVAVLDKLVDTDHGRTLLSNLKSTGEAYFAFTEDVIALGRKDEAKEATALLFGPRYATQAAYLSAVKDMVDQEKSVMAEAGVAAVTAHDAAVLTLVIAAAAAFGLGIACAWLITRSITVPMQQAVTIARSVAAGDLTTVIHIDSKDEAGQLLEALKAMSESLAGIVGAVRQSSDSIATGSGEIATGNADLSQRTEQQAANLQQTAASMEQMHSTVKQSAETARTATQLAASASAVALRGGEVVAQVVSTMDHISASSKKIADIVGVIDGIAFQTNILALNAAVEAARAGEQGRGFAVVASEVRSLAQRSAESAKQIKSLIAESVETVESGSRLVGGAGSTMTDIVSQVRRVADLIGEMSASTDEQSKGIGQVTGAVGQLDQVTQQNAALVEESAAAADSLKQQAARMIELVSIFKLTPVLLATPSFAVAKPALKVAAAAPALKRTPGKPVLKLAAPTPAVAARKPNPAPARAAAKKGPAVAAPAPRAVATVAPDQDWESF